MKEVYFGFEKLDVWKMAKDVAVTVYSAVKLFPETERYGLTSQLTRAAVSVSANIAEGSGRKSPKDRAHFYQIAYASLMETLSHLSISLELNYIDITVYNELRSQIFNLSRMLNALYNSQINSGAKR
ncbi:four helix bundle protein [bacterium]|nr:four helix bundle protein [bacterium]